jgi:hypothetical protein
MAGSAGNTLERVKNFVARECEEEWWRFLRCENQRRVQRRNDGPEKSRHSPVAAAARCCAGGVLAARDLPPFSGYSFFETSSSSLLTFFS